MEDSSQVGLPLPELEPGPVSRRGSTRTTPPNARIPRSSTRGRDAVTAVERDSPPTASPKLAAIEAAEHRAHPEQLALVDPFPSGHDRPLLTGLIPLDRTSSLPLARTWYRRELEQAGRPRNTVESYNYDLQTLETMIGPKPLYRIDRTDIARFLGEAETRSTRKRRLTTTRRFFRYLIDDARVITIDPTEGFFPHQISLRLPMPLFATEQVQLVESADLDEPWSAPAIHLMMRLGLTRGELLGLHIDHIDHSEPEHPVVFVGFESEAKRGRERRMAGDLDLANRLARYSAEVGPTDRLFPFGPPAVNAMVDRVRKRASISRTVTPQTLRHTYAVEQARQGADVERLLDLLGLVDDPRNRSSVDRYLKLAEPPLG